MTKAIILTCNTGIGDIEETVYQWDNYYEPLVVQVHATVIIVKDDKIVLRLENVHKYRVVDDYVSAEEAKVLP